MSFSGKVKDELFERYPAARHCMLAELAAITLCCGRVSWENNIQKLEIYTENEAIARKYFTLLQKTFNILKVKFLDKGENAVKRAGSFAVVLYGEDGADRVVAALKLTGGGIGKGDFAINPIIVQNTCCKRAFLRGVFLAAGSISDPKKAYHLEIVFDKEGKAVWVRDIIQSFMIDAKVVRRKKYFVVYVKEGAQIVDLLNIMEAHLALMELENVRILKEVRNSVNRQVNCEAANISKTVQAAAKQIEDILYVRDNFGFDNLEDGLREIAVLRIEYPEVSLKELGEMLPVPLGKSGVNHRLKRLSGIAEGLKEKKEEEG
ncbi:MAG: DNA-binding protein WhiA [Lachnospiraceae bacterium]|nr:DNA-binding protein WhiA [Lachnospiraceae bacterium]